MGRFDYPSPYWDSVGDPALDLIDRMLTVDVGKRITIDECLEHPWITVEGLEKNPADSTDGLTGAMSDLDFSKRKVERERTLLSDLNFVKISKVVEWEDNKAPVKVFEKNCDGQRHHNTQGKASQQLTNGGGGGGGTTQNGQHSQYATSQAQPKPAAEKQEKVFMEMGGRGDETLFGDGTANR